jgi:hypothetical protein
MQEELVIATFTYKAAVSGIETVEDFILKSV